jgi:hypothetical protein
MADESEDRDRTEDSGEHTENIRVDRQQSPRSRRQAEPPQVGRFDQTDHSPLIKERLDVGLIGRLPPIDPHCTYVLAYGGGELRAFGHKPRFGDRVGTNRCYVVDTSPRSSRGALKIPARGGRYSFDAIYAAQWRVTDPAQVVRDNVHDGHDSVDGFLLRRLGPIGRQFEPENAEGFENHIYNRLGAAAEAPGLPMGNGLGLTALTVVVTSDPRVTDRGVELDDDVHEGTLTERRTMRLQHLLHGDGSAITYHLAQNPKDTETVLRMITDARDKNERLRLEWLDRMRADDAIQEADYEHARATVLGAGSTTPPALDPGAFGPSSNPSPPIIEAGPSTAPPRVRDGNPFPHSDPTRVLEPAGPATDPPPPFDPNPFGAPPGPTRPADQQPKAPPPPPEQVPGPATPAEPAVGTPRAPRDVRAARLADGSIFVQWRAVGDVEYRVSRRLDDGRWQVIAHTKDTFIEDDEAPPGPVPVYAVSAAKAGLRSREVHSGS